jgi:hypothetical protein
MAREQTALAKNGQVSNTIDSGHSFYTQWIYRTAYNIAYPPR